VGEKTQGDILKEKFSLEGQTALITGSGRGIGKAFATAMAKAGADIVVLDIIGESARETVEFLRSTVGVKAYPYVADLSKTDMIPAYIRDILQDCGRIDILVNNAGIQVRKPALEFTLEEWNQVIMIHLTVSFAMAHAVVPGMIAQGGGKIINIASLNSVMAVPNIIAYTAAKSGVAGLTRSMAVEWSQYNIRSNAVAPGFCRTAITETLFQDPVKKKWVMDRIPMKRLAEPEKDLGYVAVFLASEAAAYVNGQIIFVDGGWLAA
jgi:NAD(P)-dependent dehydrogenase (short-subunit alcohol dehydrogenase family)